MPEKRTARLPHPAIRIGFYLAFGLLWDALVKIGDPEESWTTIAVFSPLMALGFD
ncbi:MULTISPECIES: hypothetical protein [Actinomadura]|uniref:hypothetical protein n=1 Tax=Actinomadura TaxID=1988 RepID=UPI0012FC4571|nr:MULTISPECIES: hypothetical protein [Actinomadura]